jgi:transcriptional regulator with GAF, ATPase, and Fis domain
MQPVPCFSVRSEELIIASPNPALWKYFADSNDSDLPEQAMGGAEALARLEHGKRRWLLLDRNLPDLNAEEVAQMVRQRFPQVRLLMVSQFPAHGRSRSTTLLARPSAVRDRGTLEESDRSRQRVAASPLPGMIGQSEPMLHVYRMARLVASRNTTVLLTGETGTGKELVARAIHQLSPRANRPLVIVNCAAIPDSLLESELFGHTRGAFTGAVQSQIGRFQAAHGGTLFLDEIGELSLSLQPKLLRFLETKEVQRLGSPELVRIDVRVIAATNVDLETKVDEQRFREDLFYRLSAFCIELPPLRHRREDILPLAKQFVAGTSLEAHNSPPELSPAAVRMLEGHPWNGNVRELQLVLEQACILADNDACIEVEHIRFAPRRRRPSHRDAAPVD